MATIYSKKELMKIIEEHETNKGSEVDADEKRIIQGALSYSDKIVKEVMTPRIVIYTLNISGVLDEKLLNQVQSKGFTRIPVYKGTTDNVVGVLYTKDLISIKPGVTIEKVYRKDKLLTVSPDIKLDQLLNDFVKNRTHMACVKNEYGGMEGIVSLEDVIEEVFGVEIVDESDKVVDMQKMARDKNRGK